ncbi:MAG TPA: hypothetical protein VHX86_08360 [Tepidisphaeraceae bacterium]|nr:hypothetical protein [Tepidisphaeraceae bacterium]
MNAFHFNWCPRIFSKRKSFLFAATAAVATLLGISAAKSNAAFVLMNNNSTISLSPSDPTGPGAWTVDGVNQLGEEWFWFRIGNSAGQTNLASLPETSSMLLDTTGGTENNFARFTYGSPTALQVVLTYILAGGQTGSGASDLSESLDISNDGTTTQTYHFFEYTNFNLGDSTTGQSVTITGGNTATVDGNGKEAQTVVSPEPSEYEASSTSAVPDLLSQISSTTSSATLDDVASAPSGDTEWGFEWDITLKAGGSYVIAIDKDISPHAVTPVPEPAGAVALLGVMGLMLSRPRGRRHTA